MIPAALAILAAAAESERLIVEVGDARSIVIESTALLSPPFVLNVADGNRLTRVCSVHDLAGRMLGKIVLGRSVCRRTDERGWLVH